MFEIDFSAMEQLNAEVLGLFDHLSDDALLPLHIVIDHEHQTATIGTPYTQIYADLANAWRITGDEVPARLFAKFMAYEQGSALN